MRVAARPDRREEVLFNTRNSVLGVAMVLLVSGSHSGALFGTSSGGEGGITSVQTSEIADPVGDARAATKDDADVIRASIARRDRELVFTLTLAAVPTNSDVPEGWDLLGWVFALDTNSETMPTGYPFPKGAGPAPPEFVVEVRQYRKGFQDPVDAKNAAAILIDRRPLLKGTSAAVTPIRVEREGSTVELIIDANAVGNATAFQWISGTLRARLAESDRSGYLVEILDRVPDKGMVQARLN